MLTTMEHITVDQFQSLLAHVISPLERDGIKEHIDNCQECWQNWQKWRWDVAIEKPGLIELQQFLGAKFTKYHDSSWALAREWYARRRSQEQDIADFYQRTSHYLYNLTVFYESGDRRDFKRYFQSLYNIGLRTVIDYGCGVGNDSLDLVDIGFTVTSIDYDSPSLDFFRWRLGKRGISQEQCQVLYVEKIRSGTVDVPTAELFWAVDVLEHMLDPLEVFKYVTDATKAVCFFIDSDSQAGGRHPFHFEFPRSTFNEQLSLMGFVSSECFDDEVSTWMR